MSLQIHYFAALADRLKKTDDQLSEWAGLTPSAIWQQLNPETPLPDNAVCALNFEYIDMNASFDQGVQGSELAFFPPVTGG